MTRHGRTIASILTALGVVGALAGCGNAAGSDAETLTVYSAQHESLIRTMLADFPKTSGIQLKFRSGSDAELANQIAQEGKASPADVFITENSPSINVVDRAGLLAPLDPSTLNQVRPQFRPASGTWTGFAARATALAYDPAQTAAADLPASILDLAAPQWQGRVGIAAGGPDFQAIVSAVLALRGEQATATWLRGLKANAKIYQSNTAVMKAVNDGAVEVGVMYHYYYYRDQAESGKSSKNVALKYFGNQDPGAFVSVSSAGVLASSDQPKQAQQLVAYLTSPDGQRRLAESTALEYAVGVGVPSAGVLPPLDSLGAPPVDPGSLNGPQVTSLMQDAGLL